MKTPKGYEGRRVQQTGGSTFAVSLPKAWVTANQLGRGEMVYMQPREDGSLSIYAEETPKMLKGRKVCLVSNDMPREHLLRRLVAVYISGAPLVEIRTRGRMSPASRAVVREFAQRVIGPEILEETAESVVLQDMVSVNPLPLPSVVRRMHPMAVAMQQDAMTAFETQDLSIAKDVVERDWEIDRLHWFVNKTVVMALKDPRTLTSLNLTLPDCLTYHLASKTLERIADHAVRIADVTKIVKGAKVPTAQTDELLRLSTVALGLLGKAVGTIFSGNLEEANAVLDGVDDMVSSRQPALENIFMRKGRVAVALAYVLESLDRTALYAGDLAEIAINHAIELEKPD